MSFQDWQKQGWLRPHKTSPNEIANLLAVVERDLKASADSRIDTDWRFAIAYNAALQCAAAALHAAGYEALKGGGAHFRTIDSLRLTIKDDGTLVDTLQAFRAKRAGGIYETTGVASNAEVAELRELAATLKTRVIEWLRDEHKPLVPPAASSRKGKPPRKGDPSK